MHCEQDPLFHFRENGAMLEIFYEQLNYQLLEESPAYQVKLSF